MTNRNRARASLRTLDPAALGCVRGGGSLPTESLSINFSRMTCDPAQSGHEEHIEVMSISFGPVSAG